LTAALAALACACGLKTALGAATVDLPQEIVTVSYVRPDTAPQKGGLRRGDVLLTIDGRAVDWSSDHCLPTRSTNVAALTAPVREGGHHLEVVRDHKRVRLTLPEKVEEDFWDSILVTRTLNAAFGMRTGGRASEAGLDLLRRSVAAAASLDWPRAAELAELAGKAGLEDARVVAHLGACYVHLPDYEKAEASCSRALKLDPDSALACRTTARVLLATGRPSKALRYLQRLRRLGATGKYDRSMESAARWQSEWEKAAEMDRRRIELGILPDLLSPDTPTTELPIREQFGYFRDDADSGGRRSFSVGPLSAVSFSNFVLAASPRLKGLHGFAQWQYAGIFAGNCYISVGPAGDVVVKDRKNTWRLTSLACVVPGITGNRIRIVRHGSRYDCFINNTLRSSDN
jgi:hypothetical protein